MFFEAFVREWGAWSVSVLSLGVAALAYFNSRRAVRIAATEHEWKSADRVKVLAAEASAAEERAWCERIRLHLEASPDDPIAVGGRQTGLGAPGRWEVLPGRATRQPGVGLPGGLPPGGRPYPAGRACCRTLTTFQNRLNPSRCQRITVAGSTMARAPPARPPLRENRPEGSVPLPEA